jgi:hypothetical protein
VPYHDGVSSWSSGNYGPYGQQSLGKCLARLSLCCITSKLSTWHWRTDLFLSNQWQMCTTQACSMLLQWPGRLALEFSPIRFPAHLLAHLSLHTWVQSRAPGRENWNAFF